MKAQDVKVGMVVYDKHWELFVKVDAYTNPMPRLTAKRLPISEVWVKDRPGNTYVCELQDLRPLTAREKGQPK